MAGLTYDNGQTGAKSQTDNVYCGKKRAKTQTKKAHSERELTLLGITCKYFSWAITSNDANRLAGPELGFWCPTTASAQRPPRNLIPPYGTNGCKTMMETFPWY